VQCSAHLIGTRQCDSGRTFTISIVLNQCADFSNIPIAKPHQKKIIEQTTALLQSRTEQIHQEHYHQYIPWMQSAFEERNKNTRTIFAGNGWFLDAMQ